MNAKANRLMISMVLTISVFTLGPATGLADETVHKGEPQYGAVKVIQEPVEWTGKGLDAAVHGIGKIGSALFTLPFKLFRKSNEEKDNA